MTVFVLMTGYLTGVSVALNRPKAVLLDGIKAVDELLSPLQDHELMDVPSSEGDANFSPTSFPPTRENLFKALQVDGQAVTVWKDKNVCYFCKAFIRLQAQ